MLPLLLKNGYIIMCMLVLPTIRKKLTKKESCRLRFAFLIPAHNESAVVGSCVESIVRQDWPSELVHAYVIADNCRDNTAAVARQAGAAVFERFTEEISGKAEAVRFGIDRINQDGANFDYLVIVDADNILAHDWIATVEHSISGEDGFQTYVETKNPKDSAVTFGNYLSFVFMNKVIQEGRSRLGLPALLAGTGMGFSRQFVGREGFSSNSLTEDRDLSAQALDRGYSFKWIGEAVLFDEKPLGAKASFNQYKRWSSGQLAGMSSDFSRFITLLGRGKLLRAFDMLYTMTGPMLPFSYVGALLMSSICLMFGSPEPIFLFFGMSTLSVLLLALMLCFFGRGMRDVLGLGTYVYVRLISWASLIAALIRKDNKWIKTEHARSMTADDIDQIRKGDF